ncbi:retrovirus-related Pol polyprotein from transposon 17.6 [Trichonephila clavipes]|nr:retrovirus-related Pol polyprotein from transposon 17.6 [Trichonephila clavipes]
MKVHPDSQKLMTINTHKGLYICKRLMYGLNGAPAIWQRYVGGLFQASDASPVGIGCVLSHVYPDGSEGPIAFASRTLSGSEKKYSQIDKEALSIVWATFLSRLPKTSEELEVKDDITIFQMSQIEALPVTSKELRQETSKDIELGPLLRALREGKDLQGRKPSIPLRMVVLCTDKVSVFQGNFGRTFWKNYMLDT